MKNYYKYLVWVGITTLVLLSLFLLVKTNQVLNTAATTNAVSFSGEGKVLAKPDIAVVDLAIVTESVSSKDAQNENSKKSKAVIDFLKKNIDEKDVKTTSYNIYPQYKYPQYDKPEIRGYQVTEKMEIKIRDLEKVSLILDGAVINGANEITGFQFTIDKPEKLKAEARQKAIENAKAKAEELENQLGVDLGKIVNFSESAGGFPGPIYYEKTAVGGFGGDGPTLPTGENEIAVSVTLTYQIK